MAREALKVESGIPIPSKNVDARAYVETLARMNVGDSILFPRTIASVTGNLSYFRLTRQKEWRFTCRTVEGGTRVWRIK